MKLAIVVLLLACHVYVEGIIRQGNLERAKRSAETTTAEGTGMLMARITADLKSSKLDEANAYFLKRKRSHEKRIEDRSVEALPAGGNHGRAHNLGGRRKLLGPRGDDEYYARIRRLSPFSVLHRYRNSITTQGGARYLGGRRNFILPDDYDYYEGVTEPPPPKDDRPYISPWYRHKDGIITEEGARHLGGTRNHISREDYDYDNEEPSPPKEKGPYISPWYRHKDGSITEEGARHLGGTRNFYFGDYYGGYERRKEKPPSKDDRPYISPRYRSKNGTITRTRARFVDRIKNFFGDVFSKVGQFFEDDDEDIQICFWYRTKGNMMPEEGARRLGRARKVNDHRRMLKSTSYNKRSSPHDRSHHSEGLNFRKISEKDKKALIHPCTPEHYDFAGRREKQGCKGAVAFVQKVCGDFSDCLLKKTGSATKCESKICVNINAAEREDRCYNELFQCY